MRDIQNIFINDRTCYKFLNKPIDRKLLQEIYDLMKLGPTSGNSCPLRILFVESNDEKEKLYSCLAPLNVEKTKSAPICAIFAYDSKFYKLMPKLFPQNTDIQNYFASSEQIITQVGTQNATLQAAYFLMLARDRAIACGPMGGFDAESINTAFFSDSDYKVLFLCNLGYKDGDALYPRLPRLEFEECCKFV